MLFAISVLLFSCGYMIHLAERRYPIDCGQLEGKFSTYVNSLWLVIITVFTVGYGDIVP